MTKPPVDAAVIKAALDKAARPPWTCDDWGIVTDSSIAAARVAQVPWAYDAELIVLLRNNAEVLLGALDRAQAASDGVAALRSAAEAWANVEVPEGRWSAGEIVDWLSIKADLISEGGDF